MKLIILRTLLMLTGAAALSACADAGADPDAWEPEWLAHGRASAEEKLLARGRDSYTMYCAGCHGEAGDGAGLAARFLEPKPRDFRKGRLKFAGVPAGETPRDEDYVRTIVGGLAGTSMPSWRFLPKNEIDAIVAYIKTFPEKRKPPGAAVPIAADPWVKKPEQGVEEGKRVYHGIAACMNCHPAYATRAEIAAYQKSFDIKFAGFREGLYAAEPKESDWGAPIRPPDFLSDHVKSGSAKEDLVRVIAAGVGGTAMPSWGTSLSAKQLWGLAYYVASLAATRGTAEAGALTSALESQPPFQPPAETPAPEAPAAPPPAEAPAAGDSK